MEEIIKQLLNYPTGYTIKYIEEDRTVHFKKSRKEVLVVPFWLVQMDPESVLKMLEEVA